MTTKEERKAANRAKGIKAMQGGLMMMGCGCVLPFALAMLAIVVVFVMAIAK